MDETPLLVETGKGLSIKYKGRFIYSKYAPINGAEKQLDQITLTDNTIYLIPSPLLAYGLDDLIKQLPPTSTFLFIEVDRHLLEISTTNLNISFIRNGFDFIQLLNTLDFSIYKKCELLKLNGSYDLFKTQYDPLYKILLNQLHNYWKNRYTQTQMGQLWIKNCLINLKDLSRSEPLSSLSTNKPVVIIGAGESTESVLTLLKKYRDSIFILCVDTALQILLEMDITPNAVLALESQYYNLPDFYGAKDKKIDLIYDLSSYPGVPNNLKGKRYYSVTQFSNSKLLNKINDSRIVNNFIPPLGSVGISALYIGMKLTENNIFLAGLDFSYKLGKTHSKGTPYHKTSLEKWNKINPGDSFISCLKRPILNKANKVGLVENTDSILYEYSLYAKELLYGSNRVFDLTTRGMELGAPIIDEVYFQKLLSKEIIKNSHEFIVESPENALNLFNSEYFKLDNTISILKQVINNEITIKSAYKHLKDIEYFFEHYPESEPLKELNIFKIKRLYYTLLRFKRQIS